MTPDRAWQADEALRALARQSWGRIFAAQYAADERRWLMLEIPAKGFPRHERETTQCDVGSDVPGGGAA